ncbi:hypothetical protein ABIE67_009019 [Streptomyces sp. V4I8]|uniref:hypothetical protein n=1 Tax=Streptomyces sp. V4I8 TaxID=3156469 RepID=UPI0035132C22
MLDRYHQLACQPGGLDPAGVEQERQPLVVASLSEGHIGENERPVLAEDFEQMAQDAQIASSLPDRNHVEPADHRGDGVDVGEVPLR